VNYTQNLGTRIFSTREKPIALGTDMPMDKDELNPALPHMG
jgi:hypothetical protein